MKAINIFFVSGLCLVILNGCMSTRHVLGYDDKDYEKASAGGRYSILQDHAPTGDIKVDHLPDLVPKWEAKSRGGNKSSYEVWGKTYRVMDSAKGYVAEGTASWYGKKFHGHTTSNGEIYDMYSFSAAHKSLPLPTYVKVTNLDNQRSIIVRVNDRGPFHGDRLIDLSYAAAARLDYHKKGLARVRIEAITPEPGEEYDSSLSTGKSLALAADDVRKTLVVDQSKVDYNHLQLGAFNSEESASRLKNRLFEFYDTQVKVVVIQESDGLYKVFSGPYSSQQLLANWQEKLQRDGFGSAVRVALAR